MSEAVVTGVSTVGIHVHDIARSVHFYRDLLGLPLVTNPENDAMATVELPGGVRFMVEMVHDEGEFKPNGLLELMLGVPNMDRALAQLKDRGVEVKDIQPFPGGCWALVMDPDGYPIWLEDRPLPG